MITKNKTNKISRIAMRFSCKIKKNKKRLYPKKYTKMTCTNEVNSLAIRDVNDSKATDLNLSNKQDGFVLREPNLLVSCQDTLDPFATFCNIPQPQQGDEMAIMCSMTTQEGDPNSFFERLVRGQIQSPDDLQSIFESAFLVQSPSETWTTIPDTSLRTSVDQNDYLGLNLFDVQDMAVANNASVLIAARKGFLYTSSPDGLIRQVLDSDGNIVSGDDSPVQGVTMSSSARIRASLFSNKFCFFGNNIWFTDLTPTLTLSDVRYQAVKMWETVNTRQIWVAIFYQGITKDTLSIAWRVDVFRFADSTSNPPESFVKPVATFGQTNLVFRMGFLTIQPNNNLLLFSTFDSLTDSQNLFVHSADMTDFTKVVYNRWLLHQDEGFGFFGPTEIIYTAALVNNNIDPNNVGQQIIIAMVLAKNFFQVVLDFANVISITRTALINQRPLHLSEAIDHSRMMFNLNGQLRINCSLQILNVQIQSFDLNDSNLLDAYVFALAPNGADVWIIRNATIYRLHNDITTGNWGFIWTTNFPMYFAIEAKVSDFGLPTLEPNVYVPGSQWYLGTVTKATETVHSGNSVPYEVARSLHQTFRYIVTAVATTANEDQTFPYASTGVLQRANEFGLSRVATKITVANDSNVQMSVNEGNTIIWESDTHDQVSTQEGLTKIFNLNAIPHAISSNNGLYLLYIAGNNRLRLVYNAYNSVRLAQWSKDNEQRLGQALDNQTNFCWDALHIPTTMNFVDSRCACIGGPRLFELIAPGANGVPESMLGPLQETLPCYAETCNGGTNGVNETLTNVFTFVQKRCANRIINICNQVVRITNSDLSRSNFLKLTNCGINNVMCSQDSQCDPGHRCVNGRCVVTCTSNLQCRALYGLSQLECLNGECQPVSTPSPQPIQWWVYVGIVCGLILLALLLLFVALFAKNR